MEGINGLHPRQFMATYAAIYNSHNIYKIQAKALRDQNIETDTEKPKAKRKNT